MNVLNNAKDVKFGKDNVELIMLNGTVVYARRYPYVEYTVVNDNSYMTHLDSTWSYLYYGLPHIYVNPTDHIYDEDVSDSEKSDDYNLNFKRVEVFLTDGTITNKLHTKCENIEKVRIYYPHNTKRVTFSEGYWAGSTFYELVKTIDYIDIANITDLSYFLHGCQIITSVNTTGWDTSKVTDMKEMFRNCNLLTSIDVNNWDTSNVKNMKGMFNECESLIELDVSNWHTSNVTDMSTMFRGCHSLVSIDVSDFNTSKVTDMAGMFAGCRLLASIDVNNWNTNKVTDMNYMFDDCYNLKVLNVSNWNTSNVENMKGMFNNCHALTKLNLSSFNTSKVDDMTSMFANCYALTELDVSSFDTTDVNYMTKMFNDCELLTELDVSSFDTSHVFDMQQMFADCYALETIDMRNFKFKIQLSPSAEESKMANLFYRCSVLREIRLDNCDYTTIDHVINSLNFPTGHLTDSEGNRILRKIYCKQAETVGLTEPEGWNFEYVD